MLICQFNDIGAISVVVLTKDVDRIIAAVRQSQMLEFTRHHDRVFNQRKIKRNFIAGRIET